MKSIVEGKKKELLENYKKNPNDETIAAADKDLSIFLVQLDQGLIRLGNGGSRLVLLKDIFERPQTLFKSSEDLHTNH